MSVVCFHRYAVLQPSKICYGLGFPAYKLCWSLSCLPAGKMKVLTWVFRAICEWKEVLLVNFCLSTALRIIFEIAFTLSVRVFFFCFKSLIVLELDLLCGKNYISAEEQGHYS